MPNGDIMVSFRVLNLLIVIDKKIREITWEYQDLSLGHQHDCHMLPNGNGWCLLTISWARREYVLYRPRN